MTSRMRSSWFMVELPGKMGFPVNSYRLEDRRVRAFFLGGKYPKREDLLAVYDAVKREGQRVTALAEETSMSARRVAVIVAELEAMGIVRVKRGVVTMVRELASHEDLIRYATSFEERSENDHEKLDEMMHYAQSTDCRVKTIVAYLGEEHEGTCGHCDNCRDHSAEQLAVPRSLPVPIAEAPAERFAQGDRVRHATLGDGIVDEVSLVHVHVRFDRAGIKPVAVDQLSKVQAAPAP